MRDRKARRHSVTPSAEPERLQLPVTECRGVGPRISALLARMNILTVQDLLYNFPRHHLDRRNVTPIQSIVMSEPVVVMGEVVSVKGWRPTRSLHITQCVIRDDTGVVAAVWFNQPYMIKNIPKGSRLLLSGAVSQRRGLQLENPDMEILEDNKPEGLHTLGLIPIYPLTQGIGQKTMRRLVRMALDDFLSLVPESLPKRLRQSLRLFSTAEALSAIHFPPDHEALQRARGTLIFAEFAGLQLALLLPAKEKQQGIAFTAPPHLTDLFEKRLPFRLTAGQLAARDAIFRRMKSSRKMNVLLQGDVGSGKTVLAALAILKALENGRQAVLMAPTEVLAEQHHRYFQRFFDGMSTKVGLLTAARESSIKQQTFKLLAEGDPCLVVGTHALLSERVFMPGLGLVIIDEQHRFGVNQRGALSGKGLQADLLVMTATPIPRTLALTLYSGFDVVSIKEYPGGRTEVTTRVAPDVERMDIIRFARSQIGEGRQVFVVCPEIGNKAPAKYEKFMTVENAFKVYSKAFSEWDVGFLHGKMDAEQRARTFAKFREGRIKALVATSIIEVGVDVPNASVMIIEGADRFGLSQLHQLRGRVRRSTHNSFCFLITDSRTEPARQRLAALEATNDGFKIAEQDLLQRGPGEFLGTAQAGLPRLRIGHLLRDRDLLQQARHAIEEILESDPSLQSPEHEPLRVLIKPAQGLVHL